MTIDHETGMVGTEPVLRVISTYKLQVPPVHGHRRRSFNMPQEQVETHLFRPRQRRQRHTAHPTRTTQLGRPYNDGTVVAFCHAGPFVASFFLASALCFLTCFLGMRSGLPCRCFLRVLARGSPENKSALTTLSLVLSTDDSSRMHALFVSTSQSRNLFQCSPK